MTALSQPIINLQCCCCGKKTRGRQWYNRDNGYGLCINCVESCRQSGNMKHCYGIEGIHFASREIPLKKTYKKLRKITIHNALRLEFDETTGKVHSTFTIKRTISPHDLKRVRNWINSTLRQLNKD